MGKKSVLFFCPTFNIGGVEKVFVNLANYMAEMDYLTSFLVCQKDGILKSQVSEKISIFSLDKRLSKSLFSAIKFFKNNESDVVITGPQFVSILAVLVIKIILRKKTKVIITHHSFYDLDVKNMRFLHFFYKFLIAYFYKYANIIIAVSSAVKDHLVSEVGLSNEKIQIIYNPVLRQDLDSLQKECFNHRWFVPESNVKVIVCVGRLSKIKNQEGLIKLMPSLLNQLNCKLLLIGDGEEKDTLQDLIDELSLNENVEILGAVDNPSKYVKKSSLLVLPSHSETFSLVAVESIAVGVPVLSTPTLGVMEILKDCKGCFFEKIENTEDFISEIITIIKSTNIEVDRNYVKKFNINVIGQLYENTITIL